LISPDRELTRLPALAGRAMISLVRTAMPWSSIFGLSSVRWQIPSFYIRTTGPVGTTSPGLNNRRCT
jgi:hypothetical protein